MLVKIQTHDHWDDEGEQFAFARAEKREDGWYVNTTEIDGKGWRLYAVKSAKGRDVRQLLNKAYDKRY